MDQVLKESLHELKSQWKSTQRVNCRFVAKFEAWLAPEGKSCVTQILGLSAYQEWKLWWRQLRRSPVRPAPFELSVPPDSVIFLRPKKQGLILISAQEKKVLKLCHQLEAKELLQKEIEALRSFAPHAQLPLSPYLASGTTAVGGLWMTVGFCPNTLSFKNAFKPAKALVEAAPLSIFPALAKIYQAQGVERIELGAWMKDILPECEQHPQAEKLRALIKALKAERHFDPSISLLKSKLHADLNENNIHQHPQGCTIIDWECLTPGLVLMDILDIYARALMTSPLEKRWHFKRISQLGQPLPASYGHYFEQFCDWQEKNFALSTPRQLARVYFLIYVIERSLRLFKTLKVDRFYRRGIEFRTWEALA